MPSALGLALSALVWLTPPAVLPFQSRTGPEGPPRPVTATPPFGAEALATSRDSVDAQNRALLEGPFPRAGLQRGVSDGKLLLSEPAAVRELALSRIREAGARIVRIPVNWSDIVDAAPGPDFLATDPASPDYHFALIDAAVIATASAGLTPLLVVSHAPAFAEATPRWRFAYPGSWDPNPRRCAPLPLRSRFATTAASPTRRTLRSHYPRCACSRPGTSPTSRVTWSRSGWPVEGAGARSPRRSTANCSTASTTE